MLMRLAVLLHDEEMAQVHHEGLKRMLELNVDADFDLEIDSNLWTVDLVQLYVQQTCEGRHG